MTAEDSGAPCFRERSEEWLDQTAAWLKEAERYFKLTLGLDLYLVYGSLLGAVRNRDFIPHDRDVDLAVMSRHHHRATVGAEYRAMIEKLERDERLIEEVAPGELRVRPHPPATGLRGEGLEQLDLCWSWSEGERLFLAPRITGELPVETILPLKRGRLRGLDLWIPNDAEGLLELLYGSDWLSPHPDFEPAPSPEPGAFGFLT